MMDYPEILYIDNHLLAVNKRPGDIAQGDKTGDISLVETMQAYLKEKFNKPGNVYLGLVHRIDRPVSGVLLFARTSKAAERLSKMIKERQFDKTYWAVVKQLPPKEEDILEHYLVKNPRNNKSYVSDKKNPEAKLASLSYRLIKSLHRYHVLEINLHTGRHHQIRAQLAAIGCPIKGDLKYGAERSNPDGNIHLHARSITFEHPVTKTIITITAEPPLDSIWDNLRTK